ncbi:hypothetical protein BHU72_05820 [Desulfuribacillus stibiiarsenatis]|uniref:LuxR family transcriptional regulator n=1 Tax=Desulfuribacillus stibiiarsenatis TaxID=1390249 RepID=A0A1E5L4Q5_9FIRM|nr:GIY-YIG nuclease family protein [Desulfuribacillus stibiiarsenatis]OEH85127.1 hypothetical protein BHU72_05820 [Desulfuribacillus stibiiarsenatis]
MDRKKELKEQYKQMKTDMGIFIIKSDVDNKCLLEVSQDLKARINRVKFQLKMGSYPNKDLQNAWKQHGESRFSIEILETLKYDEDESKTDYSVELEILQLVWQEKIEETGLEYY